ncbi:M20 family metallopeptidase [Wenjunlia tyrosinilytica]|uniref:Acetylornithine deacetylase n=1 Tax=Wenjunlia tyrosinilytica TaxID=1544741 RepID=A0A917ZVR5_9ACTN|nr:M20/M25/M40 family metallo-hydrolase [Wenjunlia tyrosinilytica]GGO94505.1 acetylornithine deacetylase [Wenjunlia tyrosinilytica]
MSLEPDVRDRILAAVDRDEALALLRQAVAVPSVTGEEEAFARFAAERLAEAGADQVCVEEFAEGRPNAWGVVRGAGGGPGLMFVGHLDTVHVRGWEEHWRGDVREDPFSGAVVDGRVWGRGVGDLKAGICTVIAALQTLRRVGLAPRGDVCAVFVGDEESGEPGSGISAGIKDIVPRIESGQIPRPDFAVYVEPTQLHVYTAQMGFLIAEITLEGRSAYFGAPELGVDAVRAAHEVLSGLWAYTDELERRPSHPLVGRPFLLVTGITGGGYIAVPGKCRIDLIRKLLPGESLDRAKAELDRVVAAAVTDQRVHATVAYTAPRDHAVGGTPNETDPETIGVVRLREAIRTMRPDRGEVQGAPYWSENPFLSTRLGVPAVYCAPGDIRNCHTFDEHVPVDEYLDAVGVFATFIADFCGVRDADAPHPPPHHGARHHEIT